MTEQDKPRCSGCGEVADMTFHSLCRSCAIDSYGDDDEISGPDEDYFDCGMMPDGTCLLAGTEECDWECHRSR